MRPRQMGGGRSGWVSAIGVLLLVAACSPATTPPVAPSVVSAVAASVLPRLDMPGSRSSPAGEYGWTGELGSRTGMHSVVQLANDAFRQTQMVFAVANDCFADGHGRPPIPVTVAGRDAMYAEPIDGPRVLFMPERQPGQTTAGYALQIDGRTLCVYLTWDATTVIDELAAARQVVESIRGQAFGKNGIRIVFTLPAGWDVG